MEDTELQELSRQISELHSKLRDHANNEDDPSCAALCETSAEVVGGLEQAFGHFLSKSEKAWKV